MATSQTSPVIRHLRRALGRDQAGLTDGQLLGRFLERRDGDAFAALVERHGRMVWNVCRRLLGRHDAEDAFQATFLVLCRKAATIRRRDGVASWLYGVAHQTALQARRAAARRRAREKQVMDAPEPAAADQDLGDDLRPLLDRELSRLPDAHRVVILLCDLEGKTRKDVARQLGLPEGTVGSRLARARAVLAKRLARYGLAVTGAALAAVLSREAVSAPVPTSVALNTVRAASLVASGQAMLARAVSPQVAGLTDGVQKTMVLMKLKLAAALLAAASLIGLGTVLVGRRVVAAGEAAVAVQEEPATPPTGKDAGREQGAARANGAADQDLRRLAGAWAVRDVETDGKPLFAPDDLKEARVTFDGDTAQVEGLRLPFVRDFSFKLDPARTPRAIDVTFRDGPMKGKTFEGIYVIRGDEARICLRLEHPEHGRPAGFWTGSGTTLYTLILGRTGEAGARATGAPEITVEELAAGLRKEGFQWKFVGRQITFRATVLKAGAAPKVRIEGLATDSFDKAVLHNLPADNRLKAGDRVRVTGLIVDQWYGVWQVWQYELTALTD